MYYKSLYLDGSCLRNHLSCIEKMAETHLTRHGSAPRPWEKTEHKEGGGAMGTAGTAGNTTRRLCFPSPRMDWTCHKEEADSWGLAPLLPAQGRRGQTTCPEVSRQPTAGTSFVLSPSRSWLAHVGAFLPNVNLPEDQGSRYLTVTFSPKVGSWSIPFPVRYARARPPFALLWLLPRPLPLGLRLPFASLPSHPDHAPTRRHCNLTS